MTTPSLFVVLALLVSCSSLSDKHSWKVVCGYGGATVSVECVPIVPVVVPPTTVKKESTL